MSEVAFRSDPIRLYAQQKNFLPCLKGYNCPDLISLFLPRVLVVSSSVPHSVIMYSDQYQGYFDYYCI